MQAERDHLVRFVFPRLREELWKRRIHLLDVDLRWGVTSDQDALGVCREIVDECRPRFLCMLGGRYGSIPQGKDTSITADEIHYGVLDRLGRHGSAFFYFRNPESTAQMEETIPGEMREPTGSENERRLADLKRAIVAAGLPVFVYAAHWDAKRGRLAGLQAFGQRVYDDLFRSISEDPELASRFDAAAMAAGDEFALQRDAMEGFIDERVQRYYAGSRQPLLDDLTHFVQGGANGGMCALIGPAGSGKTALMAKLCRLCSANAGLVVIPHFVGASEGSTDLRRMLRCICHALAKVSGETAPVADRVQELVDQFREWQAKASAKCRIVLVLDAVNQLDAADGAHALHWIPAVLAPRVRLIVSSNEHPVVDALKRRGASVQWRVLAPLEPQDVEAIGTAYLHRYRKRMEPEQLAELAKKQDSRLPIYILTALEELRTLGTYEEITDRIRELPGESAGLFRWILLQRLSNDPGFVDSSGAPVGAVLVNRLASALAASRHGLAATELTEMVDPGDPLGNVAALLRLLRPYLMWRGELLDFYHGQFRSAAESCYLSSPPSAERAHRRLAILFLRRADPGGDRRWGGPAARPFEELTYHLRLGGGQGIAVRLLRTLRYLDARCKASGPFPLVSELAELVSAGVPGAEAWCVFLRARASTLQQFPDTLPSLAWREGSPPVRAAAEEYIHSGPPRRPWFKLDPLPDVELPREEPSAGPGFEVVAERALRASAAAIAARLGCGFYLERLGRVAVVDLRRGLASASALDVPRARLLAMAAADDGSWVAMVDEQGRGAILQLAWPVDGALEPTVGRRESFMCRLPEVELPVLASVGGALWWQDADGQLRSLRVVAGEGADGATVVTQLNGELRGIVASPECVAAWSDAGGRTALTVLDTEGTVLHKRALHDSVCGGCLLSGRDLFLLQRNATSVVLSGDRWRDRREGPRLPGLMSESHAFCGGVLMVSMELRRYVWSGHPGEAVVEVTEFPSGYGTTRAIAENGDELFVILQGGAFCLKAGGAHRARWRILAVMPFGSGYAAVAEGDDGLHLVSSNPPMTGKLDDRGVGDVAAACNEQEMVWVDYSGRLNRWTPPMEARGPPPRHAGRIEAVAVGPDGTFWVANEFGEILSMKDGQLKPGASLDVRQPNRQRLLVGSKRVIWTGLSLGESKNGVDNLETMAILDLEGGACRCAGRRFFDPADGLLTLSLWDEDSAELACFFQLLGVHRQFVRVGTVEAMLAGRERVVTLDVDAINLRAALPLPGRDGWLVHSSNGLLLALSRGSFAQMAAWKGARPCTALACGDGRAGPILIVEDYNRVLNCSLQTEGDHAGQS